MLQTNLSDRRALGGLIGTAVLGIIGLAVGLNVIGIVIGGILGALLGAYAGKRIKENALRQKKLLNINIHIIRMAALVQHLLDFNIKTVAPQEIRLGLFKKNNIYLPKRSKNDGLLSINLKKIKKNNNFC